MPLLQVRNLQKSYGDREILKNISFEIRNGEKIGLVGWNGSGKTTLVKMLIEEEEPDQGSITKNQPLLKVGYLPQSTDYELQLDEAGQKEWETLLHTSSQLGLPQLKQGHDIHFAHLSGGEKLKLSLAKIWATHPQLLILDEPTNHLDLQGVRWLIDEIREFDGAAIIISHDRYFLDQTVSKIFEIEDRLLNVFQGNYTDYRQEKERQQEQQQREYAKQQIKIEKIEQQVSTLKQWSDKSHRTAGKGGTAAENRQMGLKEYERVQAKKKDNQIKSKLKRLEQELSKHKIEKPKEEMSVYFDFQAEGKRGKRILEAKGLGKQFEQQLLFEKSHFYIKHGEKIALLGPNGAGKTTLIKLILGEEEVSKGGLWKSDSLRIAYLSQDVSHLPLEKTALQFLDLADWQQTSRARTIFANMGMKEEKITKPISTLSLGERTRVKLVDMILQDHDILILDEPTNHLDLPSREQLEETLSSYTGTLIVVSHDLYFIEKLCDKLLLIEDQRIKRIEMGLKEYETRRKKMMEPNKQQIEEELSIIETKITELLGKISLVPQGTEEYQLIDQELSQLMAAKRNLKQQV